MPTEDGPAQLFNLTAGVVEEPGEDLPGLLGMDVLRSRQAILDVGNKRLIFPGPGEVEIKLPPGSITTPLVEAPSGHLCMIVDNYSEVTTKQGGVDTPIQPLRLQDNMNSKSVSSSSQANVAGTPGDTGRSK